MSDPGRGQWRLSTLRVALAAGRMDPFDVVDDVLRRLAGEIQPQAWIWTASPDELRARAAELAAMPSVARSPLWAVPFAVKDNIDVAGLPTTAGCPDFAFIAERTATCVQRLLDAGAILVGKTNLDQFATGLTGTRSPYGACTSVLDPRLPSGGSSSGSAVVVASGIVPIALGTDTAGSGRVPAALNGIVGLKPTRGLVSTAGVFPACRSLDCVSVFAHDVADAWEVLSAVAGPDVADPWSRPRPVIPVGDPSRLRVGVIAADATGWRGDSDQLAAYRTACDRLPTVVDAVEVVDIAPFLDAGELLYEGPWVAERYAVLGEFLEAHPASVHPTTAAVLERGRHVTGAQAFAGLHRLRELTSQATQIWTTVDALVLPTIDVTFTRDQVAADDVGRTRALGRFTHFANLLDLAVVAVPVGRTTEGRPASISVVGPAFSDATVARLAHAFLGGDPTPAVGSWPGQHEPPASPSLRLAVVGHHLSGGPRNHELVGRGARLVATTRTAPIYRLFCMQSAAGDPLPGLVRALDGGTAIEVEIWELPSAEVGSILAGVRSPLGLGHVELEDGTWTIGFLGETHGTADALDISAFGGWRAFLSATAPQPA